jgi:hypothetical protein
MHRLILIALGPHVALNWVDLVGHRDSREVVVVAAAANEWWVVVEVNATIKPAEWWVVAVVPVATDLN